MKIASYYMRYEKLPWEMGYPYLEEFDNLMPLIMNEYHKKIVHEREVTQEFERLNRDISR